MTPPWIDLVNSDWHDPLGQRPPADRLENPKWLGAFLRDHDLPSIDPARPSHRRALQDLRDTIQRCSRRLIDGRSPSAADLRDINRHLRAQPLVTQLHKTPDAFEIRLDPTARGLDAVLHAIARSFAEFLCEDDPSRLKLCDNPDCRWLFYDSTRSRTRRWCADSCGNLMKVRRFRQRHHHDDEDAPDPDA